MKYLFDDILIKMKHLTIDKNIKFTPKNNCKNNIYYKNVKKINDNLELWFNPIYYLYDLGNKNNQDFFWLNTSKLNLYLNKKSIIFNIYSNKYTLVNFLQFFYIYKNHDFHKYKNVLYIRHSNNQSVDTELINENDKKYIFFPHEYFYIDKDIKYNYFNFDTKQIKKISSQYELIIVFNFEKMNLKINQEIHNINNFIESIILVLEKIKKGGSAIIYVASFFENISQQLILILRNSFENVSIYHPHFYNYSWANWLICENFIQDNFSNKLKKILKKNKDNNITELFDWKQIENFEYEIGPIYNINTTIINNNKYYLEPKKFNIYSYHQEIIKFYQKYEIININTFYINYLFSLTLKKYEIKDNILLYEPEIEILKLFSKYKVSQYIYSKNNNIVKKLLGYKCILLHSLNISNILFDNIFIYNFHSSLELVEIWNLLKINCRFTFINLNNKNIDCFLEMIKNKYIIEKFDINTIIKKTNL